MLLQLDTMRLSLRQTQKKKRKRIAKIMYNENEMNDYEDELMSIEVDGENDE